MPQPLITKDIWFGNAALPNGQGTMAWTSLADFVSWFPADVTVPASARQVGIAQVPFRGRGIYVSDDFVAGKSLIYPAMYFEASVALGAAKAQLSQAGEQWLSLDNKVTAALVKFNGFAKSPKMRTVLAQKWWDVELDFLLGREVFFQDVASTTPAGFPISQGGAIAPGTLVSTAIAYAGSVRTYPIFTLNVPVGNGVVINQFVIKNSMSGETLVITFGPPLAAATAWTITIDCEALTVQDQTGQFHDAVGTWPALYGPVGQSQTMATTLISASGVTTGCTVGCTFKNKWEL